MKKNIMSIMVAVLCIETCSCQWNYPDPTPAASVDGDVITRGYLAYQIRDYSGSEKNSKVARELLNTKIDNVIISREAKRYSVEAYGNYYMAKKELQSSIEFEFVCDYLEIRHKKHDTFHDYMIREMGLKQDGIINWNEIFPAVKSRLAPDDVHERGYEGGATIAWDHKAAQRVKYVFKYWSVLNNPHSYNIHHLTLDNIISDLDIKSRNLMRKTDDDERNRIIRMVLHRYATQNFVIYSLPGKWRKLFKEIEKRAEEELLVEYYRKKFLMGAIGPKGRGGKAREGVTEQEYRKYIEKLGVKAKVIIYEGNQ